MKITLTYHEEFFNIALDTYKEITKLEKEHSEIQLRLQQAGKSSDAIVDLLAEKNDRIGRLTLIVVVFCATSLEAYINDYAIDHLSKSYFSRYLDKLDLLSKWIVIPRITTGTQLNTGSKPVQDLSWLINLRNGLVHYKTKVKEIEQLQTTDFLWFNDAKRAIDTVRNLVLELKKIDKKVNTAWLKPGV